MAQRVEVNLATVGVVAGALGASISLGAASLAGLDWYIVHVFNRETQEARRADWCGRELTGDPSKDRIIEQARTDLGGCE